MGRGRPARAPPAQTEVYNLEGPQGSGSLEKDKKLLLRHLMASSGSDFAGEPLTVNAYNALVYRLGQKKIARGHLQLAEKLLRPKSGPERERERESPMRRLRKKPKIKTCLQAFFSSSRSPSSPRPSRPSPWPRRRGPGPA